jgi:Domain of unknown function (DUF4396)
MAPTWLTVVGSVYIAICLTCAGVITYDIAFKHRRQPMGVMNFVFPITALYFGPFAIVLYWRWARSPAPVGAASRRRSPDRRARHRSAEASVGESSKPAVPAMAMAAGGHHVSERGGLQPEAGVAEVSGSLDGDDPVAPSGSTRPYWATMAIEVSHCGSGCTLGDFISEWVIFAFAITIAGSTLPAEYIGDYTLAVTLGIVFQYFAIAPMRGLGVRDGLKAAAKADVISLTFFEIGLFAWMALMTFVFFPAPHHLMPNSIAFWFMMQLGMIIGYFSSWPANVWLVKRGIKVPM